MAGDRVTLVWTRHVDPMCQGWYEQATLPDGRVATLAIGLSHRWVLAIGDERICTFSAQANAIKRAEKIAAAVTP